MRKFETYFRWSDKWDNYLNDDTRFDWTRLEALPADELQVEADLFNGLRSEGIRESKEAMKKGFGPVRFFLIWWLFFQPVGGVTWLFNMLIVNPLGRLFDWPNWLVKPIVVFSISIHCLWGLFLLIGSLVVLPWYVFDQLWDKYGQPWEICASTIICATPQDKTIKEGTLPSGITYKVYESSDSPCKVIKEGTTSNGITFKLCE